LSYGPNRFRIGDFGLSLHRLAAGGSRFERAGSLSTAFQVTKFNITDNMAWPNTPSTKRIFW